MNDLTHTNSQAHVPGLAVALEAEFAPTTNEYPLHPRAEWQRLAATGETQLEYWPWVVGRIERALDDAGFEFSGLGTDHITEHWYTLIRAGWGADETGESFATYEAAWLNAAKRLADDPVLRGEETHLTDAQQTLLATYCDGEFAHLLPELEHAPEDGIKAAIDHCGNGLLRFLWTELSAGEGCDGPQEALSRIASAQRALDALAVAMEHAQNASPSAVQAPRPAPSL